MYRGSESVFGDAFNVSVSFPLPDVDDGVTHVAPTHTDHDVFDDTAIGFGPPATGAIQVACDNDNACGAPA